MNLFSYDSPFSRFLYFVADIVTLHFLWILYSLPIITIGASTTALYYSCMKRVRTGEGYVTQNFRKSFRQNFKQSTILWIVLVLVGLVFSIDIRFSMALGNTMGRVMLVSCSVFLIPFVLLALYIFPVQAKFENNIFNVYPTFFLLSAFISNLPHHYTAWNIFSAFYWSLSLLRNRAYRLFDIQYFYLHFPEIYSRRTGTGFRCLWKDFLLTKNAKDLSYKNLLLHFRFLYEKSSIFSLQNSLKSCSF